MTTPATGFLKSIPETLAGIMGEIEMQETRLVEQLRALRTDKARVADLLSVARVGATPDGIRLLETVGDEDLAA